MNYFIESGKKPVELTQTQSRIVKAILKGKQKKFIKKINKELINFSDELEAENLRLNMERNEFKERLLNSLAEKIELSKKLSAENLRNMEIENLLSKEVA